MEHLTAVYSRIFSIIHVTGCFAASHWFIVSWADQVSLLVKAL